jgi:hypothetical protein
MPNVNRTSVLDVCISGASLCNIVKENARDDGFVLIYAHRQVAIAANMILDEYAWAHVSEIPEVIGLAVRCIYLVGSKQFSSNQAFRCYKGELVDIGDRPTYTDLLNLGAMHLPIGVSQSAHPTSAANILSYRVASSETIGAADVYRHIRSSVSKRCSRIAGFASRPAIETTHFKVKFEPGLEAYMSQNRDFVEFLR